MPYHHNHVAAASLLLCLAGPAQDLSFHHVSRLPSGGALVHDTLRNVTVVLESRGSGRLWHWDGATFREQVGPEHSYGNKPVFDPVLGEVHSLGNGCISTWNGISWRSTPVPHPLAGAAMAFDPVRRRLVLTASQGTTVYEWDGSSWTTMVPIAGPGPDGALIFDPSRGACVLVEPGGSAWSWNGQHWAQIYSNGPVLHGLAVAWDPAANQLLLHGRTAAGTMQTWTRATTAWYLIPTPAAFTASPVSLAWDGAGLLRMGLHAALPEGLWRLEAGVWRRLPIEQPCPRWFAAVAASPARSEILLFGGALFGTTSTLLDDTWTFAGSWRRSAPATSPPARQQAAMAWSNADQAFVLFGGRSPGGQALADTWIWNGTTWQPRTPSASPPPAYGHPMATDPAGGVALLCAAATASQHDLWRWQNGTWQNLGASPFPVLAHPVAMVHDPVRNRTVAVHGALGHEWNGSAWTQLPNVPGLVDPHAVSLAFDPSTAAVLHFEGWAPTVHTWDGVQWTPRPIADAPAPLRLDLAPDFAAGMVRSVQHRFANVATTTWNGGDALLTSTGAVARRLGFGCGLDGAPGLLADGRPRPGDAAFALTGEARVPNAASLVALGFLSNPQPLGAGCVLWVDQPLGVLLGAADAGGRVRQGIPLPAAAALRGVDIVAQLAVVDPARSVFGGLTFSPALTLQVGD